MKILLTGFEPFHKHTKNPSQYIVETLSSRPTVAGITLLPKILPVTYDEAGKMVRTLIREHHPDAAILLGLASRRDKISLERVALNLNDAEIPDNAGVIIEGAPIDPAGPHAYFGNFPIQTLRDALTAEEIPARISNHAGAYLCNNVFYSAAREHDLTGVPAHFGFIHVPQAAEYAEDSSGMPLETMVRAIDICIRKLVSAPQPA